MKTKSSERSDNLSGITRSIFVLLIIATGLLARTASGQLTTTYDGTYNGSFSGEVACATDPPVPPVAVAKTSITFTVTVGVVTVPGAGAVGQVNAFGNMNMTFPVPSVGAVTFDGTITFDGHVNGGTWSVSGLPPECSEGGNWTADYAPGSTPPPPPPPVPVPSYVPQLSSFPSPDTLFTSGDINFFVADHGSEFPPDVQAFLTTEAQKAQPLTDPESDSFIKRTAGGTAEGLEQFCHLAGLIKAGVEGELVTMAGAVMATMPFLDLTDEQRKSVGYAELVKAGIATLQGEEPIGILIDVNLYIYGHMLAPALQQVADDPPDPNYQTVVVPDPPQVPTFPSTGNASIDAAISKAYLDSSTAQSFLNAANTSYNRYSSAYAASDAMSAGLQFEALLYFLVAYDKAVQDSANDLKQLRALLAAAGKGNATFDPQGLSLFQANIAANGLSAGAIQALTGAGITNAQIQAATTKLLAVDPNTMSGTMFDAINDTAISARHASSKQPPQLANISTRGNVGTGDNVLIGGFIISGIEPKQVIIRGRGPALAAFGLNALSNPVLELHDSTGALIATNDDWQSTHLAGIITSDQVSDIQNSGLAPSNAADSAIIATLRPGSYTAIVHGVNNGTGVGIIEVFDLSPGTGTILGNISTRGNVGTGDNVLIGGFIINGADPRKVIIRARGPALAAFGLNALSNPTLELHDSTGLIATNDNWQSTHLGGIITGDQVSGIQNSGLAPSNAADSAIIATLPPGSYTAIVGGVNSGTGVGIIEVFDLDAGN